METMNNITKSTAATADPFINVAPGLLFKKTTTHFPNALCKCINNYSFNDANQIIQKKPRDLVVLLSTTNAIQTWT